MKSDVYTSPAPAPLDPVLADIARRWKEADIPDLYEGALTPHGGPVCRERGRNVRGLLYPKPRLPAGTIEKQLINARPYGVNADVPVHIVWPHGASASQAALNTLVYFHGGGFIVGDLDSHAAHAVRLANETASVVVLVDYRLAPEHRFPAAYEDCLAATRWAFDHLGRLGGQRHRVAVGGDSAGGNIAASVALSCRDLGFKLAAQLLLYPATNLSVMRGIPEKAYLGEEHLDTVSLDPRVSPLLAPTHAGLAPVILGVGQHDFLYVDNMAYAQALRAAKVPLLLREFPSLNHGFFSYTAISEVSLKAAQLLCADLKALLDQAQR